MVGPYLPDMVEETRIRVKVYRLINSTFIALIPKTNHPTSFPEFFPIVLCNLCYKIITKVIARRIKPILSCSLYEEQLGFLKGRKILDVIGIAQECLHSIKGKKTSSYHFETRFKKGI